MPIVGQFGSLAGLGSMILPGGAFESIATITVGSGGASSIEFTSIPGTYQHLQIRMGLRSNRVDTNENVRIRVNSDTGSNYAFHQLRGDGATTATEAGASQTSIEVNRSATAANAASSNFAQLLLDFLDYSSTSKNKTFRTLAGYDNNGSGIVGINSGLWMSTSAVTSILVYPQYGSNFAQYSTAALYGVRS
jgi:hypothetical protein